MSTATATASKKNTANGTTDVKVPGALKESTQALANAIATSLSVEKDGTINISGDIVEDNLPPDLAMSDIKKTQKFRGELIAATVDALRQTVLPAMNGNKEIDRSVVNFKFGDDRVEVGVSRAQPSDDGKGGQSARNGHVVVGYTAKGTGENAGEFKKARDRLSAEATAMFG